MGLSPNSNYEKKIVSCFDIREVPRSPGKWNWNWLYFLPFIFIFEQGVYKAFHKNKQTISTSWNFWSHCDRERKGGLLAIYYIRLAKWVRRRQGSPRHAELGLWLAWVRPYGLISTNNGGNNVGLAWLHKVVKIVVEVRIGLIKSIKYISKILIKDLNFWRPRPSFSFLIMALMSTLTFRKNWYDFLRLPCLPLIAIGQSEIKI